MHQTHCARDACAHLQLFRFCEAKQQSDTAHIFLCHSERNLPSRWVLDPLNALGVSVPVFLVSET